MPTPQRRTRPIIAVSLLAGLAAAGHAVSLDGLEGLALRAALGDGATWSAEYSALGFWRVRHGMTPGDVLALAGTPLEQYDVTGRPGLIGWRWTQHPHDTHYSVRVVLFKQGRVVEKRSHFYVD